MSDLRGGGQPVSSSSTKAPHSTSEVTTPVTFPPLFLSGTTFTLYPVPSTSTYFLSLSLCLSLSLISALPLSPYGTTSPGCGSGMLKISCRTPAEREDTMA